MGKGDTPKIDTLDPGKKLTGFRSFVLRQVF